MGQVCAWLALLQEADSKEGGGYLTASSGLATVVPTVMEWGIHSFNMGMVGTGKR